MTRSVKSRSTFAGDDIDLELETDFSIQKYNYFISYFLLEMYVTISIDLVPMVSRLHPAHQKQGETFQMDTDANRH